MLSNARENVWYTFERLEKPFGFVCAGMDMRQPLMRFEKDFFFISAQIDRNPLNIDQYCDNMW